LHRINDILKIFYLEKHCSKCQATFGCKNEGPGCWCESLQVPLETLGQLRVQYENCLCPACLREYATGAVESPGEGAGGINISLDSAGQQ